MIARTLEHLRHHALAATALVCSLLALAGSSYAAFTIDGSQIRSHSIDPVKLNPRFINGNVRAWAIVAPNGHLIAGAGKPKVTPAAADPGGYGISWGLKVGRCATVASVDYSSSRPTEKVAIVGNPSMPFVAGYAVASTGKASPGRGNATFVQTFDQAGQPTPLGFDAAVIC